MDKEFPNSAPPVTATNGMTGLGRERGYVENDVCFSLAHFEPETLEGYVRKKFPIARYRAKRKFSEGYGGKGLVYVPCRPKWPVRNAAPPVTREEIHSWKVYREGLKKALYTYLLSRNRPEAPGDSGGFRRTPGGAPPDPAGFWRGPCKNALGRLKSSKG